MHLVNKALLLLVLAVAGLSAADKKVIKPDPAAPAGNFSPAIQAGGTLYVSGQIGQDPKTNKIPEAFEDEVKMALSRIDVILKAAGYTFADAVAVQVYLTDMELFQRMNAVYTSVIPEPRPARTTVGVAKLVGTARIEITVTAWKKQ